jgi:hypothetical protein
MSADPQRVRPGLRPLPFRGDLIAAGAVPLAVGAVLVDLRMDAAWAAGVRAAFLGAVAALLLALAWRAPVEGANPRAYVSVLLFAAFPVAARALAALDGALGAHPGSPVGLTWSALVLGLAYLFLAARRNSGTCTLLGSVSLVVALLAAWQWAFHPQWLTASRWLSLVAIGVLGLAAVGLRDRHRAHAVALADAAGLTTLHLGLGLIAQASANPFLLAAARIPYTGEMGWTSYARLSTSVGFNEVSPFGRTNAPGWGWLLTLLLIGFALVGYGAVDRERGPVWLGVLALVAFALSASLHASLLWWPVLLVAAGAAAIVAGLRPTTPTPPSPDRDDDLAEERRFFRP